MGVINYSVQPSTIAPEGEIDYGRYQVLLKENRLTIQVESLTRADVAAEIQDGRSVQIQASDGLIGTLVPTVVGGFSITDSPTPLASQVNIGFRPASGKTSFLSLVRDGVGFEKQDTSVVQPSISNLVVSIASGFDPITNQYPAAAEEGLVFTFTGDNLTSKPFVRIGLYAPEIVGYIPIENFLTISQVVGSITAKKMQFVVSDGLPATFTPLLAQLPKPAYLQLELEGRVFQYPITIIDGSDYN